MSLCVPYDVCGEGKVLSVTMSGMGLLGSGPNTATELANTMRGTLPALRKLSSNKRVLSKLDRMPKSKSCSHSPDTADAKWNTPSKPLSNKGPCSNMGPAWPLTRGSANRSAGAGNKSAMCSSVTFLPLSSPFFRISRARRAPKNPAPPVTSNFMMNAF